MGVMRPLTIDDVLEVEITGIAVDGVQFTDDTFDGELVVRNRGDERLAGTIEIVNESETTLGSDRGSLARETVEVDLDPGGTRRIPVGGAGLVGGTGTAVLVGVAEPEIGDPDDGTRRITPGDRFAPLASMVFWDRDFYRVNYQRPRRAQYLSVAFALLSALLAGVIVLVSA
jgi:hypothetical protein